MNEKNSAIEVPYEKVTRVKFTIETEDNYYELSFRNVDEVSVYPILKNENEESSQNVYIPYIEGWSVSLTGNENSPEFSLMSSPTYMLDWVED